MQTLKMRLQFVVHRVLVQTLIQPDYSMFLFLRLLKVCLPIICLSKTTIISDILWYSEVLDNCQERIYTCICVWEKMVYILMFEFLLAFNELSILVTESTIKF